MSLIFMLFLCFSGTGLAYKSEKESSISGDEGFYAEKYAYIPVDRGESGIRNIENNGYIEESFKKGIDVNTYNEVEKSDLKRSFQNFAGGYIPLYIKRALVNSLRSIRQISSRGLTEKTKYSNYFTKLFKHSFSASSNILQKKNTNNRIYKRSFSHLSKRDQVQCVNFLEKLEDSSLNRNSRECFKESIFFSGCPNIFDIPCLCRSNNYKSHIALCIYQRSTIQLITAFAFASEICSNYASLSSSCISSLLANSDNLYKKYNFKVKVDASDSKQKTCSKSYSIFANFSILTLILIVAGTSIFIQTGILSLI
ncbi:hypothetical protein T552_01745 [Pneumocystis carinii B80]|uniref:CFEM domain-containing protein n=1 Tax=Pneumocystis carinii (strain B80) TaxID=1408658 RepID=A0A0W4ZJH6_PNEC8|nr:hypothetical protein T552_01745 [Pneumocystis carinii B80]KTW28485.1 hypothetical protein T552_01745 [Pneumocystis carinii B80]